MESQRNQNMKEIIGDRKLYLTATVTTEGDEPVTIGTPVAPGESISVQLHLNAENMEEPFNQFSLTDEPIIVTNSDTRTATYNEVITSLAHQPIILDLARRTVEGYDKLLEMFPGSK